MKKYTVTIEEKRKFEDEVIIDYRMVYTIRAHSRDDAIITAHSIALQYVADEYGFYHVNRKGEIIGLKCFDCELYIKVLPCIQDIIVTWTVEEEL